MGENNNRLKWFSSVGGLLFAIQQFVDRSMLFCKVVNYAMRSSGIIVVFLVLLGLVAVRLIQGTYLV
ncbi:unnamed protein product [Litomosoides sigmodontis]|uniref:Uncharacterized protein n=1 Tax=Litomosoides sigmodontis TaxID=42156 RepID=A0A3P6T352_LITSI|nr:unnamed protein product [Litomosoides sigmodontis]